MNKGYFAHDAVCSDSRDLAKITILDKILKDRAYEIYSLLLSILNTIVVKEDYQVWG